MKKCLKCDYVHKQFSKKTGELALIYCPFFALKECIYGEHELPKEPKSKPKIILEIPKEKPIIKYIPEFIENERDRVDWKSYHERIFTMIHNEEKLKEIAKTVNVSVSSLVNYLGRYF